MPLYENFPYTNFHELNLDWLVEKVASLEAAFPEGTIGIVKGGTGATTAESARENLGIFAPNIPIAEGSTSTLDQEISRLEDNINSLAGDIKYRILRVVTDLGLTSGTATLASCWAAMSIGDILIAPPSELAPGQVPENSGSVVLVRDAGTSGSLRFYGNRTYEQPFTNNYPSGTWHTILNDTDVIPITKGGTGATTAAEARQNLGIDFSGTVLSVAGVGADTAGNVPLKLDNLVYNALSELGLASGSTIAAVWTALPANSLLVTNAAEISNPPSSAAGTLEIYKGTATIPGYIRFTGQEFSTGNYIMYLDTNNNPTNRWIIVQKALYNGIYTTTEITGNYSTFITDGTTAILNIIGTIPAIAGSGSLDIATLGATYRPSQTTVGFLVGSNGVTLGVECYSTGIVRAYAPDQSTPTQFYRGSLSILLAK